MTVVQLQSGDMDVAVRLRPAFNMVWNAFGIHPCEHYNQAGEWIGTAGPKRPLSAGCPIQRPSVHARAAPYRG
jgi:hypothetical protein